ncbi:actin-Hypothetical protein Rho activating protein [Nesidiocoris tenuis]|uniref:Costars domain-containing protein n=1 Tax=Nesidiocoris tenuis TaxID=355587 RepID=A0ABN7BDM6_9HEMI|nr:actin-Hypothetical protein Rho activating protein [Nesidiocoris tenuis]
MTSLRDMISAFNTHANHHQEMQTLNPFSGRFESGGRSPSPRPGQEGYGKPVAGSKTEERGIRAKNHINREILELCIFIHDMGTYQMKQRKGDPDYEDIPDDGTVVVSFGDLFEVYSRINDKLVGLLIAAKKKGLVYFEPEILFQRRDDNVLIALAKPLNEIQAYIKEQLAPPTPSPSPVPPQSES